MKKAVCIGINYAKTEYALRGCINDADDWARLFAGRGFDVAVIAEKQATRAVIVAAMTGLVAALKAGDVGAVTFSGHGTWVPDLSGDEPDGRDEALVPIDAGEDGVNLLLDDTIGEILSRVPVGAHVALLTDACHSGTVYRMMAPGTGGRKARFLPPAHFIKSPIMAARMDRVFGRPGAQKVPAPLPGVVHFSGCRDHEYRTDATIDGRACGAFSYVATRAFDAAAAVGGTYAEVHREIRRHLPSWDFQQTPLLNAPPALKKARAFG